MSAGDPLYSNLHGALRQAEIMFDDIWDPTGNKVIGTRALIKIYDVETTVEIRPMVDYEADLLDLLGRITKEIVKRSKENP